MSFLKLIIGFLPKGRIGNYIRTKFWRIILQNSTIIYFGHQANIVGKNKLELGLNLTLGDFASIEIGMSDPVFIGDDVSLARFTYIRSANHNFSSTEIAIRAQGHTSRKLEYKEKNYSIVVESDVFVGAFSIILSGTHIRRGSVVAAGSVLSGSYPEYSIIVGNPARVIGNRKNKIE